MAQEMLGMFIWNEADEARLIQELIVNVTPPKVRSETPGFVAYVLFMCVRWADHINNAHQLQSMLTVSLRSIKHSYSVCLSCCAYVLCKIQLLVMDV
jgi:myosin-5